MSDRYEFRPMSAGDLPRVQFWLTSPAVRQWWGDPAEQFALISGDRLNPAMEQFIVAVDGQPFAYLQCYDPGAWGDIGLGSHQRGTRGIDQFIGVPTMINCGHGSAMLRAFADRLLAAGAPRVITDPDPANLRAIRAYEKAGFHRERPVFTPDGPALLMVRNA